MSSGMALPVGSLQRAYDVSGDPEITLNATKGPITITTAPGELLVRGLEYLPVFATGAPAYVGGGFAIQPTIDVDTAVFVWFTLVGGGTFDQAAATAFSAFNMFSGNAIVTTSLAAFNPLPPLTYQDAVIVQNDGGGGAVPATPFHIGLQYAPNVRATTSGDVMTVSAHQALVCSPTFSTVGGTVVSFGAITAVDCLAPALAIFQPGAGIETSVSYWGLRMRANVFSTTGTREAVRCELAAAAGNYTIRNIGSAQSNFNDGNLFDCGFVQILSDTKSLSLGAAGGDVQINWNGSALEFDPVIGDDMRISFAADIHTIVSASASEDSAINFDYPKGAFGEPGAPGNQKYRFVANAETITLAGGYAQFLLTQLANDTIDAALSQYFGWSINAPTPTIGTGSITDAGALIVGGNPAAGTNRYGVLILAAPSGGTLNYALRVPNGDARFDARVDINNPIALGGGAAATLGTIGATGPTVAAQAQWVEIDINGVAHWIPVWI